MASGWIKLHRKLMDSPMWTAEPFTKGQAWVDLLMLADYETKGEYKRGCVYKSQRYLAQRWHWSERKVARFLRDLEHGNTNVHIDGHMVVHTDRRTNGSIVTIENWGKYQDGVHTDVHTDIHTDVHTNGHTNSNYLKNNKKYIASEGGHSAPSLATRASDGISYRKVKNENGDWEMVPVKDGDES